ncbi:MAG: hypothetical protein JRI25_26315, partial [Deltaproteobacteria bacterium]|nr:hypothetical protein [Deltaproteobacteria bacterium]
AISFTVDSCDILLGGCFNDPDDSLCPDDGDICTDAVCDEVDGCKHIYNEANDDSCVLPTCVDRGGDCSVNSDCCSNRCHPRQHTCK